MALNFENADFFARIEFGLKLASRRFYEQKAAENQSVVVCENGVIKHVPAKEILRRQDMELLELHLKTAKANYPTQP